MIRSTPLEGADAIHVGSRIVVWDHINSVAHFVGKITHVIDANEAIGDNFVHDSKKDGQLSKRTWLPYEAIGLVPIKGFTEYLHPQFRVYALPEDFAPFDHSSFKVSYKIPSNTVETK